VNEASKVLIATALVASGLGLAYLCGPPANAPQVVTQSAGQPFAVASVLPLRLRSEAPQPAEILASGTVPALDRNAVPNTAPIVLSAAAVDLHGTASEPLWFAPVPSDSAPPPRSVPADDRAAPLPIVSPPESAAAGDEWLLNPPTMPRSFDAKTAREPSPSLTSQESPRPGEAEQDAWWTRDTPRLKAPNGSAPAKTQALAPPPSQPGEATTRLAAPIDLDKNSHSSAPAAPPISPNFVPPPVVRARTHFITDGDTLARLAERYLQDAGRAQEIFELNREILRDPNLLPIGTPLRIPGDAGQAMPEPGDTTTTGRMVPVDAAPNVTSAQPQAQLRAPTPIASASW
jgi:hypothetical protein